jgi:hypothetical protein
MILLCRNRVKDYDVWKEVFDSHSNTQNYSGLELTNMWREKDDPNNVFFTFDVIDEVKARAFLEHSDSQEAGRVSGVLDGEVYFLE